MDTTVGRSELPVCDYVEPNRTQQAGELAISLEDFFRGDFHSRPEVGIQELLRAILTRTNFVPNVRHRIGWRGLKQLAADGECWTVRINGFAGVFGLSFNGLEPCPGWLRGRFLVYYFPDPDEELVECFSLRAAAMTQSPDYFEKIREFPSYPAFSRLFHIGLVGLAVCTPGQALALSLESLSFIRTIAQDGVFLPGNGQQVPLIPLRGRDQDFPALEVASGLFNTLAASTTFNLVHPPSYLSERRFPAAQIVYDRMGATYPVAADDVWKADFLLGYGDGQFEELEQNGSDSNPSPIYGLRWHWPEPSPSAYSDRLWWDAHQLGHGKAVDKKFLAVDERPPLIILTGFLGSGKTSFLQHFIEYQTQRSRFVAVIQNEIGEVGLDGKLLDYTVTEIDEGCVCCSLIGNLKRALHGILESFSPDTIILETSGLANPKNMFDELEELTEWVRFDAMVTMVDALNFNASLEDYLVVADQVTAADVLILNKSDLVDVERLQELRHRLEQLNPHAPMVVSCRGDVNPAMILDPDDGLRPDTNRGDPPSAHAGGPSSPTHAHDPFWSRTIRLPQVLDREAFIKAIAALPASIFRVKGVVELSAPRQTSLLQYVAGRWDLTPFRGPQAVDRFLTFIGRTEGSDPFEALEALIRSTETCEHRGP